MTTVIALGGNALVRRGEALDPRVQRRNVETAASVVAAVAAHDWVVVTHGNGPQVGLLAMQEPLGETVPPSSLDVLDAETEGMIGYLLEQAIGRVHCADLIATLLTQVVVDEHDPAFQRPTKPIGPVFDRVAGERIARERGWTMGPEGDGIRRVVASPDPLDIVELYTIRVLVASGVLVIAAGGGGVPVVPDQRGGYRGVEAVVDKDLTAALLAHKVRAGTLLLLTDVDAVYAAFGTPSQRAIRRIGVDDMRAIAASFPSGSMGPKVEAACRFVTQGGRAFIGGLDDALAVLAGTAGTEIVPGRVPVVFAAA